MNISKHKVNNTYLLFVWFLHMHIQIPPIDYVELIGHIWLPCLIYIHLTSPNFWFSASSVVLQSPCFPPSGATTNILYAANVKQRLAKIYLKPVVFKFSSISAFAKFYSCATPALDKFP